MSELEALGFRAFTDDEVDAFETEFKGERLEPVDMLDEIGWKEFT